MTFDNWYKIKYYPPPKKKTPEENLQMLKSCRVRGIYFKNDSLSAYEQSWICLWARMSQIQFPFNQSGMTLFLIFPTCSAIIIFFLEGVDGLFLFRFFIMTWMLVVCYGWLIKRKMNNCFRNRVRQRAILVLYSRNVFHSRIFFFLLVIYHKAELSPHSACLTNSPRFSHPTMGKPASVIRWPARRQWRERWWPNRKSDLGFLLPAVLSIMAKKVGGRDRDLEWGCGKWCWPGANGALWT